MRGDVNEPVRTTEEKRRRRRGIPLVVGLLACSAVVWQSSRASFTDTTENAGNEMAAGTVVITDSAGSAIITATGMAPGAAAQVACIGVKYTGTLTPSAIRVYNDQSAAEERDGIAGTYAAWTNSAAVAIDDFTTFTIEINNTDVPNPPANATDCTPTGFTGGWTATPVLAGSVGSLNSFINNNTDWTTGLDSRWGTITANQWRIFRFTYQLSSSATNAAQGDGVRFRVVWEARS